MANSDPASPGMFLVADPILDYVERRDGRRLAVPAVWDYLLNHVFPPEAMNIGFAAYTRGERVARKTAMEQLVHSAHPELAPAAAHNLGQLLAEQGDVAGARAAYQQAIDSGHPEVKTLVQQALRDLEQRGPEA